MYIRKKYDLGKCVEIEEYHTARAREPGMPRLKKRKPTPEQMRKVNQRNKEKMIRRKLRMYFNAGDYFTTLTYRADERPADMAAAKDDFKRFIRKVKTEYAKRGKELRWMRNIEVGTKGGWHVHLVINRIPDADLIIAEAWKAGKAVTQLMYQKGNFADLAAYIAKIPLTDKRLRQSNFSESRNMPAPVPSIRSCKYKTFRGKGIRVPRGWELEKDSMYEGINPVTGYPFRHYTLVKRE